MYVFRKTAIFCGAFVYRNGQKLAKESKWTTRIDLNIYGDCIRTGRLSIVSESVFSENIELSLLK